MFNLVTFVLFLMKLREFVERREFAEFFRHQVLPDIKTLVIVKFNDLL